MPNPPTAKRSAPFLLLGALFLSALLIRAVYAAALPDLLNGEEAEYARIARNLAAGRGFSGIYGGPQLVHAPLYPILTAFILALLNDARIAGLSVSILAGAAFVPLIYLLAAEVAGRTAALLAAAAALCLPFLVFISSTLYSEALYLFLLVGAIWTSTNLMRSGSHFMALSAGLLWGLTYLVRPTGVILFLVSLAWLWLAGLLHGRSPRRLLANSILAMGVFALTAVPYILYTHSVTGQYALEYKSIYIQALAERQIAGLSGAEAGFGLDSGGNQAGPQLDHTAYILENRDKESPSGTILRHLLALGPGNLRKHLILATRTLTLPFLALAFLGLLSPPYTKRDLLLKTYLLLLALASLFVQLGVPQFVARFVAPLLPFILVWGGQGAGFLLSLLTGMGKGSPDRNAATAVLLAAIAITLLLLAGGSSTKPDDSAYAGLLARKEAGTWLQTTYGPGRLIMDAGTVLPYYAGGELAPLPYAPAQAALPYIAGQEPDFIVLQGGSRLPYTAEWLDGGIPDPRARLIFDRETAVNQRIQIYQWET